MWPKCTNLKTMKKWVQTEFTNRVAKLCCCRVFLHSGIFRASRGAFQACMAVYQGTIYTPSSHWLAALQWSAPKSICCQGNKRSPSFLCNGPRSRGWCSLPHRLNELCQYSDNSSTGPVPHRLELGTWACKPSDHIFNGDLPLSPRRWIILLSKFLAARLIKIEVTWVILQKVVPDLNISPPAKWTSGWPKLLHN